MRPNPEYSLHKSKRIIDYQICRNMEKFDNHSVHLYDEEALSNNGFSDNENENEIKIITTEPRGRSVSFKPNLDREVSLNHDREVSWNSFMSKRNSVVTRVSEVRVSKNGYGSGKYRNSSASYYGSLYDWFHDRSLRESSSSYEIKRHFHVRSSANFSSSNVRLKGFRHYCYNTVNGFEEKCSKLGGNSFDSCFLILGWEQLF